MSYEEKSTVAMTTILVVVFGAYFTIVGTRLSDSPARDVAYLGLMVPAVLALVVLAAVTHAGIALAAPRDAGVEDERDRLIHLRGDRVGAFVLGTGVFGTLVLAAIRTDQFWVAQSLLATLVAAELATGLTRLALYRRDR